MGENSSLPFVVEIYMRFCLDCGEFPYSIIAFDAHSELWTDFILANLFYRCILSKAGILRLV